MVWAANYATAIEISRDLINIILDKLLQILTAQNQHQFSGGLGALGNIELELTNIEINDLDDPGVPGGGVLTDLEVNGNLKLRLFGIQSTSRMFITLQDVSIDFVSTPAGVPKGLVIAVSQSLSVRIRFAGGNALFRAILNNLVGPLVSLGIWLAFRIIRKIEIPIWQIVDIFSVLGLRFDPVSPLLTAQDAVLPDSLLVASGFNLTQPLIGNPNLLASFNPPNTNIGAVVHERIAAAGVDLAFTKGWVPSRIRAGKWKIYINTIIIKFEQDTIRATGGIKAKRGSCWCKVKVRITYDVAIEPKITNTTGPNPQPTAVFKYDADINTQISTSGMLAVLGTIMVAPLFMGLTIGMSVLVNIALKQFLPFSTSFSFQGGSLSVTLQSVNFSGFVPFQMNFPLQLNGQGTYDLSNFQQYLLPGNVPINVGFTDETIAVQPQELRVAVGLS